MKSLKISLAMIVIFGSIVSIGSATRAFIPYPMNYVERLGWLEGLPARSGGGFYGLNCSGLIANAHGGDYMEADEMFAGGNGKLRIVAELPSYQDLKGLPLQPGDVAAFEGTGRVKGAHVAAYLGSGLWIDADSRRGDVRTFDIGTRAGDPWFAGEVRILRWRS